MMKRKIAFAIAIAAGFLGLYGCGDKGDVKPANGGEQKMAPMPAKQPNNLNAKP